VPPCGPQAAICFWGRPEALENKNINFFPQISMFEVDSAAVDWLWHLLAMREVEVCLHTHFCVLFVFLILFGSRSID